jgi:tetratricopeptide (TPR) repeat protein
LGIVVVFLPEALGSWLLGQFADAVSKRLGVGLLGGEQERALRAAGRAATKRTARELRPGASGEDVEHVARVIDEVFRVAVPAAPLEEHATLLQALQAGMTAQLAVLGDATLTETGQSSAQVLDLPVEEIAETLTRNVIQEILLRGAGGGALAPLANQLDHDVTHLQGRHNAGMLDRIADELAQLRRRVGPAAPPVPRELPHPAGESTGRGIDLSTLRAMRAGPAALGDFLKEEAARTLIGREQERDRLARFAASIQDGRSRGTLLVVGAAGIGKTRLLAELQLLAEQAGVRPVAVACPDPETRVGLDPWRALVATLWLEFPANPAHDTTTVSDLLATLLNDDETGAEPPQLGNAHQYAHLLAAPVVDILEQAAVAQPLLVIVEDAHNLDDPSVTLLRETTAQLAGKRIGFVAAIRHTDLSPGGQVGRWRKELQAAGHPVLELGPLGQEEVGTWLPRLRGVKPTVAAVELAWERSGGNPLALRYISLDPHDPHDEWNETEVAVRPVVRNALLSTLKRRSEACRDWLAAVAVVAVGQRFDPVLVARVARQPQRLADQCRDEAQTGGIITGRSTGRLTHDLWRHVVLAELSTTRVGTLHARAFHALRKQVEQIGDNSVETTLRLARHALQGRPHVAAGDIASAVLDAARGASRRSDYKLAIELCERGREVATDPRQVFNLLLEQGDAQHEAGDFTDADDSYAKAGDLASAHGDREGQALAALRSARTWWTFRDSPLRARLESALDQLHPGATQLRAQLQAHLARVLATEGVDLQRKTELARAALSVANVVTDPMARCEIVTASRQGLYDSEPPSELIKLSQQLRHVSSRSHSVHFHGEALIAMLVDLLRLGRIHEARVEIEEHREYAIRTRRPLALYLQRSHDSMMALWEGEFERAQQLITALTVDLFEPDTLPANVQTTVQQLVTAQTGWLFREQGQAEILMAQEAVVVEMVRQAGYIPLWRAALALLYCEIANHRRAVEILTEIAQESDGFQSFPPHGWAVPTLFLLAEICDELHTTGLNGSGLDGAESFDPTDTGRRLGVLLEPHLDEMALVGWPGVLVGPVARAAGLAALTAGDADNAIRLLEVASHRTPPSARPTHARLHFDQGRAHLERGAPSDHAVAMGHLEVAVRAAEELGMHRIAKRAQALAEI